jgi:hypothetical protein
VQAPAEIGHWAPAQRASAKHNVINHPTATFEMPPQHTDSLPETLALEFDRDKDQEDLKSQHFFKN